MISSAEAPSVLPSPATLAGLSGCWNRAGPGRGINARPVNFARGINLATADSGGTHPPTKRSSESDFDSGGNQDYVPSGRQCEIGSAVGRKHLVGVINADNVGGESR